MSICDTVLLLVELNIPIQSVFNHYNRVRANFEARLDEEHDEEWYSEEDCEYILGFV